MQLLLSVICAFRKRSPHSSCAAAASCCIPHASHGSFNPREPSVVPASGANRRVDFVLGGIFLGGGFAMDALIFFWIEGEAFHSAFNHNLKYLFNLSHRYVRHTYDFYGKDGQIFVW